MNATTPQKIRVRFFAGSARKSFEIAKKSDGVYFLPDGREAYFSPAVMNRIAMEFSSINCTETDLSEVLALIDAGGSEKKLVLVQKTGKGPTEKSAKFKAAIEQSVYDEGGNRVKRVKMMEFTLPVSQIEDAGDGQLAAPLWLILEKLDYKKNSSHGQKHRAKGNVVGEFVPAAFLSGKPSSRVLALKDWISSTVAETAMENERANKEREAKQNKISEAALKIIEALKKEDFTSSSQPSMLLISRVTPYIPSDTEPALRQEIINAVRKLWVEHVKQARGGV